jgi:hypothetical protein
VNIGAETCGSMIGIRKVSLHIFTPFALCTCDVPRFIQVINMLLLLYIYIYIYIYKRVYIQSTQSLYTVAFSYMHHVSTMAAIFSLYIIYRIAVIVLYTSQLLR